MFNVVVLAGTGGKGTLEEQQKVENKAFININGRPMITYVLETIDRAPSIRTTAVVGPSPYLERLTGEGYSFTPVPEEGGLLQNMAAGLRALDRNVPSLVTTSDIPLLTVSAVEDFLSRCSPYDHDLYYPIISRDDCERRFPGMTRTYVRLKEGHFSGGNMVLVNPAWVLENLDDLVMFISYRKKPWKLLRLLPLSLVVKFFTRRLTVPDLEAYLSRLFNARGRAILTGYVEIGADLDKISDLEVISNALGENS